MGTFESLFFKEHLLNGMTIVDVGANIGLYTLLFSKLVGPAGRVISLEPDPELFSQLASNIKHNDCHNVIAHACAAGDVTGSQHFLNSPLNSGNNRLVPIGRKLESQFHVPIRRIDDLLGDKTVDWLKIDVQGWEPAVLSGAKGIIQKNPQLKIYFEFWPKGLVQAGFDPYAFLASFEKEGLQVFHPAKTACLSYNDFKTLGRMKTYIDLLASR